MRGAGCDCLGLVRGVWRALHGAEPLPVPVYPPDWAEATGAETLLEAARACLVPVEAHRSGDVLLFRIGPGPVRHCAIAEEGGAVIHALSGRAVRRDPLDERWRRRLAARFAFPEVP